MDILKKLAPCACMRNQPVGDNGALKEDMKISIKTSCCRKTKIININISGDNVDALKDVKEIIDRIENNVRASTLSRENSL
jgi:uncharacterized Rossmann fold enzyme